MYHRSWVGSREIRLRVRTSSCSYLAKFRASDCRTVSRDGDRYKEKREKRTLLGSIYRCDYLAPLTSAGYRRVVERSLHVWRVIPWMELAISSLDLPTWPAGPAKWTVGRRRRACSTRGNASYRLRLASFMHIHGRPAGGRTRAHGCAHDYPIPPRSEEVYLYVYMVNAHTRGAFAEGQKLQLSLFLSSRFCLFLPHLAYVELLSSPSRANIIVLRSRLCILGLYAIPCLWEVASDLISRLVSFGADPLGLRLHLRSRSFSCVLVKLQHFRVERMRFDAGHLSSRKFEGDGIITLVSPQGRSCRRTLSRKESSKSRPTLMVDAACALMTVDRFPRLIIKRLDSC